MYVHELYQKKYEEGFYKRLIVLPRILFFFSTKRHPLEVIPTPYQGTDMIFELQQHVKNGNVAHSPHKTTSLFCCFPVFPWAVPSEEHTPDTLRAEDG